MPEYVPPFAGQQASSRWADYFRRREKQPDISIPQDRANGTLDGHYREYRARCEAQNQVPLPFGKWNAARNTDPSIY